MGEGGGRGDCWMKERGNYMAAHLQAVLDALVRDIFHLQAGHGVQIEGI